MGCIKCGRDIEDGQVFCQSCLEVMAKYPVKPNIAIQLPSKKDAPAPKKSHSKRRQPPTPEEQILRLKRRVRTMVILWFITLCLLAATIYPTIQYFLGKPILLPGQNYSTITTITTIEP